MYLFHIFTLVGTDFLIVLFLVVAFHAFINIVWMLYAWESPEAVNRHKSPKIFAKPFYSFTALVPARHETKVIQDTLMALNRINYPDFLKEIIVICHSDDDATIQKVEEFIKNIGKNTIKLVLFSSNPINKPHALNVGRNFAKNNIIVVFDAEDEPHPDIYNIANTLYVEKSVDVIQSGVQLMNFRSHWYAPLNVLEYFFWFKSVLPFFANHGLIPLGGNTVFFKKTVLNRIHGWDENCLTEDADIGMRLSVEGAKTIVVYDEKHTTQEETPHSLIGFIKQRTRWKQGFLQILWKGSWNHLPSFNQRMLAGYIFFTPLIELLLFIYIPISLFLMFHFKFPVPIALLSLLPLYIVLLQILLYIIGLYEFTRDYNLTYPFYMPLQIIITFFPYQILLGISTFRALVRVLTRQNAWEKTLHLNMHRERLIVPLKINL